MPTVVLDFQSLIALATVAFVVTRLVDALVKPIWEKLKLDKFWLLYVSLALGGTLTWFTKLNVLPIFSAELEVLGRVVTCLAGGLGPSFIFDLWVDQPQPPQE